MGKWRQDRRSHARCFSTGASAPVRDTLHFAYRGVQRGVRKGRYKLIEYVVDGSRTTQFFDLETDPHETVNLADEPRLAATLAELRGELARWRTELGDTREMSRPFWNGFDAE